MQLHPSFSCPNKNSTITLQLVRGYKSSHQGLPYSYKPYQTKRGRIPFLHTRWKPNDYSTTLERSKDQAEHVHARSSQSIVMMCIISVFHIIIQKKSLLTLQTQDW